MSDPFINIQGWTINTWTLDGTPSDRLPGEDFWVGSSVSIGFIAPNLYAMSVLSPTYSWLCQVSCLEMNPAIEALYEYGPASFPAGYVVCYWSLEIEPDGSLQGRIVLPNPPDTQDGGGGTFTATANPPPMT